MPCNIKVTVFKSPNGPFHEAFVLPRIADARSRKHPLSYRFCLYAFFLTLVPKAKLNIFPPQVA